MGLVLMKDGNGARTIAAASLLVSGLLLSGCMGSPTYGTGVSANEQLATDVSSMFSLKPKRTTAEYKPRPELVKPTDSTTVLPPPQENIVTSNSGEWPESPEQRRARIRDAATENRDNLGWEPEVVNDIASSRSYSKTKLGTSSRTQDSGIARPGEADDLNKQGARFRQARAMTNQGSPTVRRTLTEPPLDYRQPAATASADELGEDEFKKQRRLKAEARKASGSKTWKDYVPWL